MPRRPPALEAEGLAEMTLRSPLGAVVGPTGAASAEQVRRMAKAAWHSGKTVVISLDWLTCDADRRALTALADRVHGPRPTGDGICGTRKRPSG
jgi:hypothetical protein